MPHITLPEGLPGIRGPMAFRPETAKPLNELVDVLLRGAHILTRGERELIGPFQQFQARDAVEWFERRGVKLKGFFQRFIQLIVGHAKNRVRSHDDVITPAANMITNPIAPARKKPGYRT